MKSVRKMSYKCPTKIGNSYKFCSSLFILFVLLNSYEREENCVYNTHNQHKNNIYGLAQLSDSNQIYSYNIKYQIQDVSRSELMKCQFYSHTNISNFKSKYINGNKINKNGLRVCHWNKSHSKMQSRMAEIKNIVHLLNAKIIQPCNCLVLSS